MTKKIKRTVCGFLATVMLLAALLSLTSCSGNGQAENSTCTSELSLPDEYHIELSVKNTGLFPSSCKYILTRCDEGAYIYNGNTDKEYIFESIGNGKYIEYQKNNKTGEYYTPNISDALWKQINAGNVPLDSVAVDENAINGLTSVFTVYFDSYESVRSSLEDDGTENIAGYSCNKYTLDTGHFGGRTKNEYWIEPESGLCMKVIQRYRILFLFNSQKSVECNEFSVSELSLPERN